MGTFRCGLLLAACLMLAETLLAQDTNPATPVPALPGAPAVPVPGPDTNAAPPVLAPQTDITAAQPAAAPETGAKPAAKKAAKPKPAAPALPTVRGTAANLDTT